MENCCWLGKRGRRSAPRLWEAGTLALFAATPALEPQRLKGWAVWLRVARSHGRQCGEARISEGCLHSTALLLRRRKSPGSPRSGSGDLTVPTGDHNTVTEV